MGTKREIFENLASTLSALPWVKTVEWERIRITETDIRDHEIPLIQIYDTGSQNEHQRGNVQSTLGISIELILKQTSLNTASQSELFDMVEEIENAIGGNINLGVSGVIHLRYVSNATDLHTIEPYYYAVLNFEAIYNRLFSSC